MYSTAQEFILKLRSLGYTQLTPIQKMAIPSILKGKHTLIVAPTGHGKTEAAIIPVMYHLFLNKYNKISALYISPLRALNRDLEARLKRIGQEFGVNVSTRHGDNSRKEKKDVVLNPPDLLITTPETLLYLITYNRMKNLLSNLRWIIIDELQEMLDEKRGYELSVVIQRIKRITKNPRIIGLSATISNIELAKAYLSLNEDVEVAKIDARKEMEVIVDIPQVSREIVDKSLRYGKDPVLFSRLTRLVEIIEKSKPTLIFTNTRETAEFLAHELGQMFNIKIASHHGSLSREVRMDTENEFKKGKLDAIVATSSLELGIDIGNISLVIQYMSPRQCVRLVQRVGRSGHSLKGVAKGIVIPGSSIYDVLESKAITELSREYLEPMVPEENPLDVIAHQLAGMVIDEPVSLKDALEIFHGSPYFKNLSLEELEEVIEQLQAEKVIKREGDKLKPSRRTWKYYYSINMIPDSNTSYTVIDTDSNQKVGNLDFDFVSILSEDDVFILGGKLWRVISIDDGKVYVVSAELKKGDLPSWFGEAIPVEKEISMKVYSYLEDILSGKITVEKEIREKLEDHLSRNYPIPRRDEILVELIGSDLIVIHSPFGSKGNNTLGSLICAIFASKGYTVSYRNDPYHIVITSMSSFNLQLVNEVINKLSLIDLKYASSLLESEMIGSPQFKWILLIEAQRFGAIDKGVEAKLGQYVLKAYIDTIIGKEAIKEFLVKFHDLDVIPLIRKVKWNVVEVPSPSPLAEDFLQRLLAFTPSNEKPLMIEVFKRRMMNKELLFICLMCGWNSTSKVSETPNKCPKCDSVFITSTFPDDKEAIDIIRKNIEGKRLNGKERKRLSELKLISSLFTNYGRMTFLALAVRGIGPSNLANVLRYLSQGEDKFYEKLMEEERKFIRYRKYWQ